MVNSIPASNETTGQQVTLLIPQISDLFCMSICYLIQDITDMKVSLVLSDWDRITASLPPDEPAILILQYEWIKKHRVPEVAKLVAEFPTLSFLFFLKPEDFYLASFLFQFGVQGFFSDNITRERFKFCLTELMNHRSFFSQDIIPVILSQHTCEKNGHMNSCDLTQREFEILELIVKGYTNKEIANQLCLSPRTIEGHRARLIMKYGVRNTAGLVGEALKNQEHSL